jgi:hypothetical protein
MTINRNTVLGAILLAFISGYFMGMGDAAWRISERSLPKVHDIITGSIVRNENSSIAPRRPPKKAQDDDGDNGALFQWPWASKK